MSVPEYDVVFLEDDMLPVTDIIVYLRHMEDVVLLDRGKKRTFCIPKELYLGRVSFYGGEWRCKLTMPDGSTQKFHEFNLDILKDIIRSTYLVMKEMQDEQAQL